MYNTLRTELYKLKLNRAFWLILLLSIVLNSLMHYLAISGWWQIYNTPYDAAGLSEMNGMSMFMTPLFFNLMIGTLAAFFTSTEFSATGVIKNQIISGQSRKIIYFSKYFVYTLASLLIVVITPLVTGIIINILLGNIHVFTLDSLAYLLTSSSLYVLQLTAYTAIITLLAIVTNDSGKTIIFSILFTIIMYVVEKVPIFDFVELVYDYSIFQQFNLVLFPDLDTSSLITSLIVGFVYLFAFLILGMFVFSKKEIK